MIASNNKLILILCEFKILAELLENCIHPILNAIGGYLVSNNEQTLIGF